MSQLKTKFSRWMLSNRMEQTVDEEDMSIFAAGLYFKSKDTFAAVFYREGKIMVYVSSDDQVAHFSYGRLLELHNTAKDTEERAYLYGILNRLNDPSTHYAREETSPLPFD